MKLTRRSPRGFSITEMLVGALVATALGIASYRILTTNTQVTLSEIGLGTQNKAAISAFDRLERDLRKSNPSWARQGVSVYYPHPGLGPEGNIAADPSNFDGNGFNPQTVDSQFDAITFLTAHPQKRQLFRPTADFTLDADTESVTVAIRGAMADGLSVGDVVLIYQAGEYAVMRVDALTMETGHHLAKGPTTILPTKDTRGWFETFQGDLLNWNAYAGDCTGACGEPTSEEDPCKDACADAGSKDCDICCIANPKAPSCPVEEPTPLSTPNATATAAAAQATATATAAAQATAAVATATAAAATATAAVPSPTAAPTGTPASGVTGMTLTPLNTDHYLGLKTAGTDIAAGLVVTDAGPNPCSFNCGWGGTFVSNSPAHGMVFVAEQTAIEAVVVNTVAAQYVDASHIPVSIGGDFANVSTNSAGERQPYMVWSAWSNEVENSITNLVQTSHMPIDNLRFGYSVFQSENMKGDLIVDSLAGGAPLNTVFQHVGLSYTNDPADPLDLFHFFGRITPNDPGTPAAHIFNGTYKVTSVFPQIRSSRSLGRSKTYSTGISVTSPFMKKRYQPGGTGMEISKTVLKAHADQEHGYYSGQPLYIDYENGEVDLVVPKGHFHLDPTGNLDKMFYNAKLNIYDRHGNFATQLDMTQGTSNPEGSGWNSVGTFYPTKMHLGEKKNELWISGLHNGSQYLAWSSTATLTTVDPEGNSLYPMEAVIYVRWAPGTSLRTAVQNGLACSEVRAIGNIDGSTHPDPFLPALLPPEEPLCIQFSRHDNFGNYTNDNAAGLFTYKPADRDDDDGYMFWAGFNRLSYPSPMWENQLVMPVVARFPLCKGAPLVWSGRDFGGYSRGHCTYDWLGIEMKAIPHIGPNMELMWELREPVVSAMSTRIMRFDGRMFFAVAVGSLNDAPENLDTYCNDNPCVNPYTQLPFTGAIWLYELGEDGSFSWPRILAVHNAYSVSGVEQVGDDIFVGGRVGLHRISGERVREVIDGNMWIPGVMIAGNVPKLLLDEVAVYNGTLAYVDGYEVWRSAIHNESAATEQFIGGIGGFGVTTIDTLNYAVAYSNSRYDPHWTAKDPARWAYRDIGVAKVGTRGFLSRGLGTIDPLANINKSTTRVSYIRSPKKPNYTMIPPGNFLVSGNRKSGMRRDPVHWVPMGSPHSDPEEIITYTRGETALLRSMIRPNGPGVDPDDSLTALPAGGGSLPGNCTCGSACNLPCAGDPPNPMTVGATSYGFGCPPASCPAGEPVLPTPIPVPTGEPTLPPVLPTATPVDGTPTPTPVATEVPTPPFDPTPQPTQPPAATPTPVPTTAPIPTPCVGDGCGATENPCVTKPLSKACTLFCKLKPHDPLCKTDSELPSDGLGASQ